MAKAHLGFGANLGERARTLHEAISELRTVGEILSISSLYETEPVGYLDQPPFLNGCVILQTALAPGDLLDVLKGMESRAGRVESFRNAPRPLDIDILLYIDDHGEHVIRESQSLTIPHPRMQERGFVLVPLAEIAPDVVHPVLLQTITQLRDTIGDAGVSLFIE